MITGLKKYFKDTSNLISFVLGLIPAFIFYVLKPMISVPLWLLLAVVSILCVSVWLTIKTRIDINELSSTSAIRIIECSHNLCLCKSNNLLTHSSWVTFCESSGEYEEKIAFGRVENINSKNVAQIVVYPLTNKCEDILSYINNEKSRILVLPTITTEAIQQIYRQYLQEV